MLEESHDESFKPSLGDQQSPVAEDRPQPGAEAAAEVAAVEVAKTEVAAVAEAAAEVAKAAATNIEVAKTEDPPSPIVLPPLPPSETPFSEQITQWLDAGDRMSESVPTAGQATEPTRYRALRSFIERFRAENFRYRALIAGAVVLSVTVVGITRHQAHKQIAADAVTIEPSQPSQPSQLPEAPQTAVAVPAAAMAPAPAALTLAPAPPIAASPIKPRPRPRKAPVAVSRAAGQVQACKTALGKQNAREAVAACRVVAAATPRSADALVLLAKADLMAGRQSETLELARSAVTLNPKYADAYLLVGSVQQTVGHKRDARLAYETYLQLAPRGRHAADVRSILRTL